MIREPATFGFDLQAQRHWVAVFWNPPTPRHWIEFLSGKWPRHVMLMTYLALPGIWIHLDWGRNGMTLCIVENEEAWRLLAVLHQRGAAILRWTTPAKKPRQYFLAPNCVGWAQRFLGIPGLFWTPAGLLRKMQASGAPQFFDVSITGDTRGGMRGCSVQHLP